MRTALIGAMLIGCSAGTGAPSPGSDQPSAVASVAETAAPTEVPTPEPSPTPVSRAAVLAMCDDAEEPTGEPVVLEIRTANTQFDQTHLEGPRHCEPFIIALTNVETRWDHNLSIKFMDANGVLLFSGALVPAPTTVTYEVPALPAGEYYFFCSPHPTMRGTLVISS